MERKRLEWLSRRVGGLTVTQKLTAGALVAVMVATGIWVAGRPITTGVMEPILDQPFSEADLAPVTERLHARSIRYEVREGKVFVPADQKLDALSDLYYTSVLTGQTKGGFETLTRQMNIWDPPSKTDKMFNHARETTVERVIGRFKGVRKATVVIDPTVERHIGQSIRSSAMVDIQTHGDGNPRQLATAAVNVLTGAVANLTRQRVKVTIDGASFNTGGDELAGNDLMARKQQCEQMYVSKVRQLLEFIPDVVVSVSVDLNVQSVEEEKRTIDPEDAQVAQEADEADADAVAANTVPPAKSDKTPTRQTVQKSRTPAGKETVKSASVAVPRSYFVGIYLRGNKRELEPTDALLQPVVEAHAGRIRGLVRNALGLESEADVTVEAYEDAAPVAAPAPVVATAETMVAPTAAASITSRLHDGLLVGGGVLGMLLLSLLLRRGRPVPQYVADRADVVRGLLDDGHDDADAHQMFRRVRDVAGEHPEQAARVLREWIHQGR